MRKPERTVIAGPAGGLEAVIELPASDAESAGGVEHFAVVCHPHPLHGGTLDNKVVHTLARAIQELGVPAIRFNFRGVGGSAGTHDEARGETEDALAVVAYGRARWPGAQPWLAGFSFGGAVAVRAAGRANPERLIAVSPAISRVGVPAAVRPECPWLVVQGDADDVVPADEVVRWCEGLVPRPQLRLLKGAGHFLHGRLPELRAAVIEFARAR